MEPRSSVRPSLPFVYSLFVYVIRIRKITVALLTAVLLSNPVAAATLGAAPFAANKGQDLRYEFYSSGWAKSLGINLTSTAQGTRKGWDGKGAPKRNRPAPARAENNAEREARVAQIKIYPGDVEIATGEQVIFAAVTLDSQGNAIGGLDVKWEALREDEGQKITMRQGSFSSPNPGKFIITAEMAGRREQVRVVVKGKSVPPEVKSTSEIKIDSRELRRKHQISRLAPAQGGEKRLIAGKNATAKQLRASSKSMGRAPGMLLLPPDEDGSGWNSETVATFSNVGNERGNAPGRAPSAGVGSGNFRITAPGVSLDGRGIDINLPLHYNSRVWHKSGGAMYFDIDRDALVAGWNIGFGKIVMTGNAYMLVDGDGTRHEFTGITNIIADSQEFEGCTTDGTFIDYSARGYRPGRGPTDGKNIWGGGFAEFPDGTGVTYGAPGNYAVYPVLIVDAHGNYAYISYRNNQGPNIETITDTLGRVIRFHYDSGDLLTAITVPGLNGGPERQVVRLAYRDLTLSEAGSNYGFGGVSTVVRQNTIPVLLGIYYPATGNGYWFGDPDSYSRYGMIRKVSERRGMTFSGGLNEQGMMGPGEQTRVQVYSNPSSPGYSDIFGFLSDTPTYTQMTEDWLARGNGVPSPITYFSVEDTGATRKTTVTRTDGVRQEQITDNNLSSGSYAMMVENIVYPASGDTPLARSRTYFETGAYQSSRPVRVEAFDERGQMTVTTFGYGSRFNAPTEMREYGYSGQLLKRVHTEYLNDDNYNGPPMSYGGRFGWMHIFNLVSVVEVYAGDDSTRVSRVEYEYDGASLEDAPGVVGHSVYSNPHDPHYDPRSAYRGNLTRVRRYADSASLDGESAVVETFTYDITGNLRVQSTSCCEQTTFNYTATTRYAWPESMVRGSAGDPAAQNKTSAIYDFNTGLVMEAYDANNRRSNTVYNANSLRPEYGYLPTGAYVYHIYNDAGLYTNDIVYEVNRSGSDFASRVDTQFDGRGQVIYEAAFGKDYVRDAVESVYDNLGRLWKRTRPFKEEANPQKHWAVTEYDSMDRPVRVTSPDGSVTQSFYNESSYPSAATSNAGQTVRSRDAWGRERWARLDEQNRLVEVVEPNPSGDGSVASGGMSTQYYYDTLGNLTQVNQGAQTRRFRYDSLGRLTHQKLAERDATLNGSGQWVPSGQWSDVFYYDQRSNLVRRVDARGVQTRFNFFNDPLNRLQEVVYDKSGAPANLSANIPDAPNVIYSYMTGGDTMRVREVNASNGMWNRSVEYDIEGRVSQVKQTFAGRESYPLYTNYLWDTLSRIKEVRYPQRYGSGEARKVVTHSYDIASRLTELKYDGTTMASGPVYNASDQITSLLVGGQITENYSFDPKTGLLLSQQVNKGPERLLDLQYNYTLDNDPNNNGAKTGQLTSITDLKNTARNRAYEYDKLGRLAKVKGGVNAFTNPTWYQTYSYDPYGNKTLVERTDLGMAPVNPGSQSRSDLIGKIGPGTGGAANRIFSVDDPFAALGINEGYGSITTGFSDSDSARTPVRGGPRVTAEEYGAALSVNGIGGKSLAERPADPVPNARRKEYGARRGLSIVTAQSVTSVSPTAYQSPDPGQLGAAVNSPSNTGHGHTIVTNWTDNKTCVWHSFQGVSGQILSITLKFDWGAVVAADVQADEGEWGESYAEFTVEYSLDGGASWNGAAGVSAYASASDGGSDGQANTNPDWYPYGALTTVSIPIPLNTPISQIRVRDRLLTSSTGNAETGGTSVGNSSPANTMVNNIRLEVETDTTAPVISNVAAGSITTTSATITWTTNENSDSQVEYGPTTAYGKSTTLNPARVTAHSQGLSGLTPGTLYHYQVKSKDAAGNLATSADFSFTTLSGNAAAFVSQNVPATMTAGEAYAVTVRMLNQGTTTWTPGQAYRLGSQNPQDNTTWMTTNRVGLSPGDSVSPGATTTFSFVVTAPSSPGSYNFQWQMVQDGVEWFGAKTPNMAVQVVPRNDSAEFISQTVPSVMEEGAAYSVSITFRNTGNTTWTDANHYRLGSWNPVNNGTWGLGRVYLEAGELVPPGGLKTFSFQVVAPSTPGSYNFQWLMLRELVNWFGAASTNLVITVSDRPPLTVTSFAPASGATNVNANANVIVTFSQAMNAATVNGSTVELRDPSNALVSAAVSYDAITFAATLDPVAPLAAGANYTARVRGGSTDPRVKDVAGNALADDLTWTFTTAPPPDTTPPIIASFSPAAAATNVNAYANVTVTFSEAMDAASVNGSTVELRDLSNTLVSAAVSYDAASHTATLDPTASLSPGVTYTARVRGGGADPRAKDAAGNALAADLTWTFTISQSGLIPLDGLANLSYNAANNRITTPGFEYDPAGNQTRAVINASGTQQQYRYDCAGRLTQVLDANGTPLAIYSYVEGAQRLMSVEGGVTTYYAWAGGQISAEYEASGTNALMWKMSYVYMGGKLLATDQAEGIRYHHPDTLGTRLVTDASDGAVISEQLTMPFGTQVPYGSTLGGDNSWQHPGRSNLSKKKFTSYDRSEATGLDYAMNRFYSPQQGRFTQVDPIGMNAASLSHPQTLNLYAYCGNDPINNVDPDGLFFGAIWNALKAIGKAIASFFSSKIKGISGPGFRTPPTFPGNTPSTISVSSGGNVNFRTPPFVNGFQQVKVGWHRNSNNDLVDELGSRIAFEIEPMQIRAFGSVAEQLAFEMNLRAKGMKGLIGKITAVFT
jgi:RHS repeat-associated protein